MKINKRLLRPERLRRVPKHFDDLILKRSKIVWAASRFEDADW